jgi:glycosyltransferase involved in cell wall biosynthesis
MMSRIEGSIDISVIIPVGERHASAPSLYAEYKQGIAATGRSYEMIFVIDGHHPEFVAGLELLAKTGERFVVVTLSRTFGESTAIMAGFERATGNIIVTLPAYQQIAGSGIGKLVAALDANDMTIGLRHPRVGGLMERARRGIFHGMLGGVTGLRFNDLGCTARAFKRKVLDEIRLYGDQHRFLPVLADRQGFKVREVEVAQSAQDRRTGMYAPRTYTRGFLDIFTVFFLARFTKKPLRFFGMIGVVTFSAGLLELLYLLFDRIYLNLPLADRPALLLSSLLIVLGVQIFALGLLGELIIFAHARQLKDYQVDRVIQYPNRPVASTSEFSEREKLRLIDR